MLARYTEPSLLSDIWNLFPLYPDEPLRTNGRTLFRDVGDKYQVAFEIPGYGPEDVHVTVTEDTVRISGEIKENNQLGLSTRRFDRVVRIPQTADGETVTATVDRGILKVMVAKRATAQPREIPILQA